ncbi:MAG: glycosyltransferase family 39 protein [Anaerolineae bacterium]|nr:glycosyltransferase family 39 protein [Anaerolineae bacterium]
MIGWVVVAALLVVKVITHAAVLFPMSTQVGIVTHPYLMLHGRVLYLDVLEHRPPLPAFLVALTSQLTGLDVFAAARGLNLGVVLLSLVLIYVLVRRLKGSQLAGVIAVLYYAALESAYLFVIFYFDTIAGLALLVGVLLLIGARWRRLGLLGAGIAFGVALALKPHGALAVAVAVLWLIWDGRTPGRRWIDAAVFLLGAILPTALTVGLYGAAGLLGEFFYWNFTFNALYGGGTVGTITGDGLRRLLLTHVWMLPFLALARRAPNRRQYILVFGVTVAAFVFHIPRFGEIHVAAALPLLAVQAGLVLGPLIRQWPHWRAWHVDHAMLQMLAVGLLAGITLNVATSYLPTPAGPGQIIGMDDVRPVADWLREHAGPDDTLYVIPSTDSTAQIVPLSGRMPPGTWVTWNIWGLAPPFVADRLLAEWEIAPPTWIVRFPDLVDAATPERVRRLLEPVWGRYTLVYETEPLPFYGRAEILHLR